MIRNVTLSILFVALVITGYTQEETRIVNRSSTVHIVEGREYYFHVVLRGQTIFAIARAYGVTEEDIINENPELMGGRELIYNQMIRVPVKRDTRTKATGDEGKGQQPRFIEHRVRSRETIFGLSRQYNITQEELIYFNPELRQGLRVNSTIRIPVTVLPNQEFITYTVPPRQTLFSISREFNVSIDEIKRANNGLKDGLRAGQTIKIPIRSKSTELIQESVQTAGYTPPHPIPPATVELYCANPVLKAYYQVALMIPLYLDKVMKEEISIMNQTHPSFAFMEYLEGMLIAVDSIRGRGVDVRLLVYDVCDSIVKTRSVLNRPEIAGVDLIIGPFHPNSLEIVGEFARGRGIPIVSPLYNRDNLLARRFPNLFQATPSFQEQINEMARFIAHAHPDDNLIVIYDNQPASVLFVREYKRVLNEELNRRRWRLDSLKLSATPAGQHIEAGASGFATQNHSQRPAFQTNGSRVANHQKIMGHENLKEVVFNQDGMGRIIDQLDSTRLNVLISLMGGQAAISNITRQLHQLRVTYPIKVFGVPQWAGYESLDVRYLQSLNVHLFTHDFIDYTAPHNVSFIRRFRSQFFSEPGVDAHRAVQTGMFFFDALARFGRDFYKCIPYLNNNQDDTSPFWFQNVAGANSGWENKFVYIIRYNNFNLERVSDTKDRLASQK